MYKIWYELLPKKKIRYEVLDLAFTKNVKIESKVKVKTITLVLVLIVHCIYWA